MFRDPTNAQRRFIPLRLDDAEIRGTLKQFAYVDWREKSDNEYARLLEVCGALVVTESEGEMEEEQTPGKTLGRHTSIVWCVAVTHDSRFAISGSEDTTLKVWDLETGAEVRTLEGHSETVRCVAVTFDSRYAISGSNDDTPKVWNLDTGEEMKTLEGHTKSVTSVTVTPDSRFAISGSLDKTLKVWDLETEDCIGTLEGHTDFVSEVAMTPDGQLAISGSADSTVRVWDLSFRIREPAGSMGIR